MKRLLFVRHGETAWNAGQRLQGHADIELSARGRAQAEALRPIVQALAPERVLTSSLRRARVTAELLGFPDAESRDELREIDVGDWTGAFKRDLVAPDEAAYWDWRLGTYTPPGGETWAAFSQRSVGCIRAALSGPQTCVLVVAHSGVLRALLQSFLGLSPDRAVSVGPASLTILQYAATGSGEKARLEVFNFSPSGPLLEASD